MVNVGGGSVAPVVTPVGGGIEKQVTTNVPKDVKANEVVKQSKELKTKEEAAVKSGDVKSHEACRSPLQTLIKSLQKLIGECDEKRHKKYLESLETALADAQQQVKDLDATIKDLKKHIEEEEKKSAEKGDEDEEDAALESVSAFDPKKCGSLLKKISKLPKDKPGLPFACGVKADKTAVFVLDIPGVAPTKLRDALKDAGCKAIACGNAAGADGEMVLDVANGMVPNMSKLVLAYVKNTVKSAEFSKVRAKKPEDDAGEEEVPTGRQAPKPPGGADASPANGSGPKADGAAPKAGGPDAGGGKTPPADDEPKPAPAAPKLKISADVGEGAANRKADVLAVQQALNRANGNQDLKEDGVCGSATKTAIRTYQEKVVGYKRGDGRIDPGGPTESWLNGNKVPLPKPAPGAKPAKKPGGGAQPAKPGKAEKAKPQGGGTSPAPDSPTPGPDPEITGYIASLTGTYEKNLQAAQAERDSLVGEFENSDKGWTSLPAEARDFIARIDSELAAARAALSAFDKSAHAVADEPKSRTLESFKQQIAGDNKQTVDAIEKPMFTISQARNWLKSQ